MRRRAIRIRAGLIWVIVGLEAFVCGPGASRILLLSDKQGAEIGKAGADDTEVDLDKGPYEGINFDNCRASVSIAGPYLTTHM